MTNSEQAAQQILNNWQRHDVLACLDDTCRPANIEQGYAVQQALAKLRNEPVVGWKIAATSAAGQAHINVAQPLAGRLYQSIVHRDGERVSFAHNRMQVAEAEIVLTLGAELPVRKQPYTQSEVASAVSTVSAGLELPDSRFSDFTAVGEASLAADHACASRFVLGEVSHTPPINETLLASLARHPTRLLVNDEVVTSGVGSDALGGPLAALTWLANQLGTIGTGLLAGQFVTTGVTGKPSPVSSGSTITADLGEWGRASVHLT